MDEDEKEFQEQLVDLEPDRFEETSYEDGEKWVRLAQNPKYKTYRHCLTALATLLASQAWRDHLYPVNDAKPCCVLDLGVGSGEKLALIADATNAACLLPLDISTSMLLFAFRTLRRKQERRLKATPILPVRVDFLNHLSYLFRAEKLRSHLERRKLLFMSGSTFSNFDESQLLGQFGNFMSDGDLVILGVEFHTLLDGSRQEVTPGWFGTDDYLTYWHDPDVTTYHAARKVVRINNRGGQSRIAQSIAIETWAEGTEAPLLRSTRYDE